MSRQMPVGVVGDWVNHRTRHIWEISILFSLQLKNYPRNLPQTTHLFMILTRKALWKMKLSFLLSEAK